jgi:predicted TIM-barrel fold metal-dependent hydrolase
MARGLIDVHAHHYPDTYLEACRRRDSGLEHYLRDDGRLVVTQDGAVALAVPQPLPDMSQRLSAMDAAGVQTQVLSVSAPNVFRLPPSVRLSLTRQLNDEMAELVAASKGRLQLFASLPLPDVDAALEELDRMDGAAAGFILCTTVDRHTLDDEKFAPLLEEFSRRQSVVFVHPTTGCCTDGVRDYALSLALDFLAETTNAIGRLVYSGTIERHPGMRWVFTHLGGTLPFVVHRLDNYATQFPENRAHITAKPTEILRRLYFDTVTTHPPALRCALDTFCSDQLLFGTDYPHVPGGLEVLVATLESAGLGPEELRAVGSANAARLLSIAPTVASEATHS